jgi:hypothetical protein
MEPSNISDIGFYERNKVDDIGLISYTTKLAIIAAQAIIEIKDIGGISPYFKAVEHCLNHVANGGTIDNFKPLVRTSTYAGTDRREAKNAVY